MNRRARLLMLGLALAALVIVGWITTGSFDFALHQFWFTAGLFLLILLSLVDQPHFSKDANVFVNGATGWISLVLVQSEFRDGMWRVFLTWSTYLIVSSYCLMWIRNRKLGQEARLVQVLSRVNREVGRPEALFSAFFLWGCLHQFGAGSTQFNALLLYWTVFMILNLPALAKSIESALTPRKSLSLSCGRLRRIISPRVAEATFGPEIENILMGRKATITVAGEDAGEGVIIDDRIVKGDRIVRLALARFGPAWPRVGDSSIESACVSVTQSDEITPGQGPVAVVDVGTEIGAVVFHVHPDASLQTGEVLWTQMTSGERAYFQIVSAKIFEEEIGEANVAQRVRVFGGQLGVWDPARSRFDPVTWVAPAGNLIHRADALSVEAKRVPEKHVVVGTVPNSDFPVHLSIEDAVTHNTAIIGVTGSGKSYLAFHLIEAMLINGIKVLILDMSRQHYMFLQHLKPFPLKKSEDVPLWLQGETLLGIHQFAINDAGYPQVTAKFVEEAFKELSKRKLQAGLNEPARLCIVFEEAHSLIPEWNQVAQDCDRQYVNKTARTVLQGRKYGMGCLIVTQRTANVTKTILNQCNTIFALQSFDQTGLDFLRNYMGEEYSHAISTLPARTTILVGRASSSARPILLKVADFSNRWKGMQVFDETDNGSKPIDSSFSE